VFATAAAPASAEAATRPPLARSPLGQCCLVPLSGPQCGGRTSGAHCQRSWQGLAAVGAAAASIMQPLSPGSTVSAASCAAQLPAAHKRVVAAPVASVALHFSVSSLSLSRTAPCSPDVRTHRARHLNLHRQAADGLLVDARLSNHVVVLQACRWARVNREYGVARPKVSARWTASGRDAWQRRTALRAASRP
jgi:hypothetical protein